MNAPARNSSDFPWPLQLRVSPVEAFVEIPISGHARYSSIEIQRLINASGTGLIAIVHRIDGIVDVYFEPVLALDLEWRTNDPAVAHLPSGVLRACKFAATELQVGVDCIVCEVAFTDQHNDEISLSIEQASRSGSRIRQFVPMPAASTVAVLRLLLLDCFCMIRRRGSRLEVRVGGQLCQPRLFWLPVGFSKRYSGRFSQPVLLAGLNPAGSYPLQPPSNCRFDPSGGLISCQVGRPDYWFQCRFEPALPRPETLDSDETRIGSLTIDSPLGRVSRADYRFTGMSQAALSALKFENVTQNWFPSAARQPTLAVLAGLRWRKRRKHKISWAGHLSMIGGTTVMVSAWSDNSVAVARGTGSEESSAKVFSDE